MTDMTAPPASVSLSAPETRGIELIPDHQRRGRARDLLAVWAAPNVSIFNFTIGATLILLGLDMTQAIIVTILGSLPWILTGVVAIAGPSAGTASSVITRAIFGIVGNRLMMAILGGLMGALYMAIGWAASSFLGAELLRRSGLSDSVAVPILVTVVVSAITILVAVYGYDLIVRAYPYVTAALLVVFLIVTGFVLPLADWGYTPAEPLDGPGLISAMSIGFTILAATPLSYTTSPDFSRYLPRATKRSHIVAATALGGAIPTIFFTIVGALIATGLSEVAVNNGFDSAMLDVVPVWLGFLLVIGVVVNTVAINAMNTYSASMSLQSIGLPMRRIPAAILIGSIATLLTIYFVLASNLLDAVNLTLQFTVIAAAPVMGIFVVDVLGRRGDYKGTDLFDEEPGGRFWFTRGWSLPGMVAIVGGGAASALCLTTDIWAGPIAESLGFVDLSVPVGLIVAGAIYAILGRLLAKNAYAR